MKIRPEPGSVSGARGWPPILRHGRHRLLAVGWADSVLGGRRPVGRWMVVVNPEFLLYND